jgi:hypothetical protein
MEYQKFLNEVIMRGIKAAKRDYKGAKRHAVKEGSIAGFEACKGKNPIELSKLLDRARKKAHKIMFSRDDLNKKEQDAYWWARGFELEIEWVCDVVSAVLFNEGKPVIINPTARGMLMAAEIVGVKKI